MAARGREEPTRPPPASTSLGGQPTTPDQWTAWFFGLIEGKTPTLQTLEALQPEFEKVGARLEYNARRTAADLVIPGYGIVDVVRGFEGPEGGREWQFPIGSAEPLGSDGGRSRGDNPVLGYATDRDTVFQALTAATLAQAMDAARRQRSRTGTLGRQSTIVAGWNSAPPRTRATAITGF